MDASAVQAQALCEAATTCDFALFLQVYEKAPHLLHDYIADKMQQPRKADDGEESSEAREKTRARVRHEQPNVLVSVLEAGRVLDAGALQIVRFILEKEPQFVNVVQGLHQETVLHTLVDNGIYDLDYWKVERERDWLFVVLLFFLLIAI
jgi:hypothetical protein